MRPAGRPSPEAGLPPAAARRFEAVVLERAGTVPRALLQEAGAAGLEVEVARDEEAAAVIRDLWLRGIAPAQVLVVAAAPDGSPGVVALGAAADVVPAVLEDQIARRRHGEPPWVDADPLWTLTIDGVDPQLARAHESLLTLADGRLGTRGSSLVGHDAELPAVVIGGVYAGTGPDTTLLQGPRWNVLAIAQGDRLRSRRTLDLRTGTLTHELTAGDVRVDAVALSSRRRPGTAVLRAHGHGAGLERSAGLRPPQDTAGTVDGAADGSWLRTTGPPGSVVAAVDERVRHHARTWSVDRIACYAGTPSGIADEHVAIEQLERARGLGFEGLLDEHRSAWARRWEDADVVADGDADLQLAIRFALFHLMASAGDDGEAAVGARGLTGPGYRGHVFWDSDVYVLPFLAATHPAAARAMLEYRIRRLPAALHTARVAGRAGARFPWESAATGEDVTPRVITSLTGAVTAVRTGALEEHIVADVAWAAAHYADWTGDRAFATGPGLGLLVQTARWWASRIELEDDGAGHIRGVMGPDEYHGPIDDNAYTNVMARWTLRRAAADAPPGALDGEERRRWLDLAEALVDGYDPVTGRHEQFAGFSALEPVLIADVAPSRPVAAELLLGPQRTAASQVVKQADVLMLHYLVPDETPPGSLVADLDHYEPRTAHGSTLSPGVHATLLARAGRTAQALELLRLTARIDLDDLGQTTAAGLHLAAMGSVWRALAFGFGGLRPGDGALAVDPRPVPGIERLELRVQMGGSRVRVSVSPGAFAVSADPPVTITTPGHGRVDVGRPGRSFDLVPRPGQEGSA